VVPARRHVQPRGGARRGVGGGARVLEGDEVHRDEVLVETGEVARDPGPAGREAPGVVVVAARAQVRRTVVERPDGVRDGAGRQVPKHTVGDEIEGRPGVRPSPRAHRGGGHVDHEVRREVEREILRRGLRIGERRRVESRDRLGRRKVGEPGGTAAGGRGLFGDRPDPRGEVERGGHGERRRGPASEARDHVADVQRSVERSSVPGGRKPDACRRRGGEEDRAQHDGQSGGKADPAEAGWSPRWGGEPERERANAANRRRIPNLLHLALPKSSPQSWPVGGSGSGYIVVGR